VAASTGGLFVKFMGAGVATAIVDNAVFFAVERATHQVPVALVAGRIASIGVQYLLAKRAVFVSDESHARALPKYLLIVLATMALSYGLIRGQLALLNIAPLVAKLLAEGLMYLVKFFLQKDYVFRDLSRTTVSR
jgi:putative flippase GtrA